MYRDGDIYSYIIMCKSDYMQFKQLWFKKHTFLLFKKTPNTMFLFFVTYPKCKALGWPCNSVTFSLEMQSF